MGVPCSPDTSETDSRYCFAALLGLTGLTAAPALAEDPVEVHGLKGEYYTQSAPGAFDFDQLKATTFDPVLDFDNLEPRLAATTGRSDDASVRWTGRIVPEKTGPHTFSVIGDNGFRLWVDGRLLIDHWVDDWDREQTADPIDLTAGTAYDIKVEYFEHYGGSNLHLRWTEPGGSKEAVPQSAFRLPAGFDYDGPVATTVLGDGRTLKLDFAQPLAPPPAGLADHLEAVIGGAKWPLGAAEPDPADPRALLVALDEPVVGNKTGTARGTADVRYDGEGGLTAAGGNAVGAFWSSGPNHSTYQLRTEWADEVGPDNALPEYPRPQLTRPTGATSTAVGSSPRPRRANSRRSAGPCPSGSSSPTPWSPSSPASNGTRTACGTAAPSRSPPTGTSAPPSGCGSTSAPSTGGPRCTSTAPRSPRTRAATTSSARTSPTP